MFRRIVPASALAAACFLAAQARAATATSTFVVTGNVIANCTISTTGITFSYDPVEANATANATASGTLTLACTKGSAPSIALTLGANSAQAGSLTPPATRAMRLGATANFLGYDIYWPGTTTRILRSGWISAVAAGTPDAKVVVTTPPLPKHAAPHSQLQ